MLQDKIEIWHQICSKYNEIENGMLFYAKITSWRTAMPVGFLIVLICLGFVSGAAKAYGITWGGCSNLSEKSVLKQSSLIFPSLGPIVRLLMPRHCIHYRLQLLAA